MMPYWNRLETDFSSLIRKIASPKSGAIEFDGISNPHCFGPE